MPISICEYTDQHIEAVRQFNVRLEQHGAASRFSLSPRTKWLPKVPGQKLFQECFVALDETAAVRGAFILKHQDFWIKDRTLSIADYRFPLSEGAVDKHYPQVGVQLLRAALQKQPLLFGLGMGSYDEPLARLLQAARWCMFSVPFYFQIVHPSAFLRNIAFLRRSPIRSAALDLLAWTGLGWLGIQAVQSLHRRNASCNSTVVVEPVGEFSHWADELWQANKNQYGMSAVRDAETLRLLYPEDDKRFIRLKLSRGPRPIGWAVMLDTPLANHRQFGHMRLGSIVDCFASPADATEVLCAAAKHLRVQGVDLIVSNQSHAAWGVGFRRAGFLRGPSNFIFAASPKLVEILDQKNVRNNAMHVNRGDGDGPINL